MIIDSGRYSTIYVAFFMTKLALLTKGFGDNRIKTLECYLSSILDGKFGILNKSVKVIIGSGLYSTM